MIEWVNLPVGDSGFMRGLRLGFLKLLVTVQRASGEHLTLSVILFNLEINFGLVVWQNQP